MFWDGSLAYPRAQSWFFLVVYLTGGTVLQRDQRRRLLQISQKSEDATLQGYATLCILHPERVVMPSL